ncbi:hypothetical protein ACOSQ4_003798 [Xanthoceras sorbifolium]
MVADQTSKFRINMSSKQTLNGSDKFVSHSVVKTSQKEFKGSQNRALVEINRKKTVGIAFEPLILVIIILHNCEILSDDLCVDLQLFGQALPKSHNLRRRRKKKESPNLPFSTALVLFYSGHGQNVVLNRLDSSISIGINLSHFTSRYFGDFDR